MRLIVVYRAARFLRHTRGFSLLEVLIAVAIFALIASVAYASLARMAAAESRLERVQNELETLQRALNNLELDLRHAVPRSARGAYQNSEAALRGDATSLIFGSTRVQSTANGPRLEPVRVRHRFVSDRWFRAQFTALDLAPATAELDRMVLNKISATSIRYFDHALQPQTQWPSPIAAGDPTLLDTLPRAIEIQFQLEGYGRVRRLMLVTDAPPPLPLRDEL
jgi:general secretion pathway protein J